MRSSRSTAARQPLIPFVLTGAAEVVLTRDDGSKADAILVEAAHRLVRTTVKATK
jgi:hypothetical protein